MRPEVEVVRRDDDERELAVVFGRDAQRRMAVDDAAPFGLAAEFEANALFTRQRQDALLQLHRLALVAGEDAGGVGIPQMVCGAHRRVVVRLGEGQHGGGVLLGVERAARHERVAVEVVVDGELHCKAPADLFGFWGF